MIDSLYMIMMIFGIIGGDVMVFVLLGVFVILLSGKSLGRLLDCENANFTDRIVYFIVFPRKLLNLLGFRLPRPYASQ